MTGKSAMVACIALISALPACSSNDDAGKKTDTVAADGAPPETAALGQPLKISITVPAVPAGTEGTKCLKLRLGNSGAVKIGKIHNQLGAESHHLIVSAVDAEGETEAPLFDCSPFRAALIGAPLTVTQKHDDVITMPDGVGFPLADDQLMHLEMHYINTSEETADVTAVSELYPLTADGDVQEASFLIVGNVDIHIPAKADYETPAAYVKLPDEFASANFYAATGHTHRFGTAARLSTATGPDDPGTSLYDPPGFSWTEAELKYFEPAFKVPSGGGFRFQCKWNNPTDKMITYGESALQEMCFFWAYYYPRVEGPRTIITGFDKSPYKKKDAGATDATDAD